MKTKLIIATATVAGAVLISYLLKKKEAAEQKYEPLPVKKSHHLTNVFAQAKKSYGLTACLYSQHQI